MRSQIRHQTVVIRDGRSSTVNVPALVPGDFIELRLGDIVPADVRLVEVTGLECDESVLTASPCPPTRTPTPFPWGLRWRSCPGALIGPVVHAGAAR